MNHSSHEFQSISREQWQNGVDRHQCGLCSRDYGDPIHCVSSWSLVIVIEDCFIPEWSQQIRELATNASSELIGATVVALANYAEVQLKGERLN